MKRKTAKEILAESFREVAETKPIDKITIQDIVDNCGYSPATFYRQFSDRRVHHRRAGTLQLGQGPSVPD